VGERLLGNLMADSICTAEALRSLDEADLYRRVAIEALHISSRGLHPLETRAAARSSSSARLAVALAEVPAARWWSEAVGHRAQVWMGREGDPSDVPAQPSAGRGKPKAVLWTSSAVEGMVSAWQPIAESGYLGPGGPWRAWRIHLREGLKIFEVRSAADWDRLCRNFPGEVVDGFLHPDWSTVREHLDGVHLTVEGLVRAQAVETGCPGGAPTRLWGWDAESTAWLRWPARFIEPIGVVQPG
jgi:hypothetical protein